MNQGSARRVGRVNSADLVVRHQTDSAAALDQRVDAVGGGWLCDSTREAHRTLLPMGGRIMRLRLEPATTFHPEDDTTRAC